MSWWNLLKNFLPISISVISLFISIFTAFKNTRDERFKLDFELVKWFGATSKKGAPIHLWLTVTNNSKIPCSILEISLKVKDSDGNIAEGVGRGNRALVSSSTVMRGGQEVERKEKYSLDYPQNIDAYSSLGGYFHIYSSHAFYHFEEKDVEITIKTNRGSITKKIFFDRGKNIFRVFQNESPKGEVKITHREDGSEIIYLNDGI